MYINSIKIIFLVFILFQSLHFGLNPSADTFTESEKKSTTITSAKNEYSLNIEEIDSLQFFSVKDSSQYIADDFLKITNLNEVKKRLKNIAVFDEEILDYPRLVKLKDRKNQTIKIDDEFTFVAYYPEEDILLCEGGHSIDVSFNLKNGEATNLTGNPDKIVTSMNKKHRLNGHFGGQQCSSYFIQKKSKDQFQKVIQLDTEFEKLTNKMLCDIGDAFWINDNILFVTEDSSFGLDTKYYKIKIIEGK